MSPPATALAITRAPLPLTTPCRLHRSLSAAPSDPWLSYRSSGEKFGLDLDLSGITDEAFWDRAEERIYAALKSYAEQVENGDGYQRRLFADDAARGFAFIDLCRKRYDAIVMNPPYSLASQDSDSWVREKYERSCNDLYGAFSERAFGMTAACRGFVGALTSKTFLYSKQLRSFRARLREDNHRLLLLIDLLTFA